MKPRSPLTAISGAALCKLLGKSPSFPKQLAQRGAPLREVRLPRIPYKKYIFNLYSLIGWFKNQREAHLFAAAKEKGRQKNAHKLSASKLQENIDKLEQYINTYKHTHTMPEIAPTTKNTTTTGKTTTPPKPFRQYPADRRMLTGDSVWTTLFFGRSNGVAEPLLNRLATVTKDEDNFGCVLVRFGQETATHSIPVCNLILIRSVEDTPVLSIIADSFAYYITTKGVAEAVAAFWYGGKSNRLKDDARALAELNLDLLKKENA